MVKINTYVERMAVITRGMRALANTGGEDTPVKIDLRDIVAHILDIYKGKLQEQAIRVEHNIPRETFNVISRQFQLEQVLFNLVANAEFAMKGIKEPYIRLELKEIDGVCVLSVTNNGPKIEKDVLEKMYSPFFTTKPVGTGTGLGLSVGLAAMIEHRGNLSCISTSDHTTFSMSLPSCNNKGEIKQKAG